MAKKCKNKPENRKMSLSGIRRFVEQGVAIDITNLSFEDAMEFRKNHDYDAIGVSHGSNGMTGALLEDRKSKQLFAITAPNSTLLQLV